MATKNIVPRADGEGQVGTTSKAWAKVVTDELTLINAATEISTDGTLAGNVDTAIPSEKAVKTYADTNQGVTQVVVATYTTVGTLSTGFPNDDTIPQITEGDEILSCAITPQNASSTIVISYDCILTPSTDFALAFLFTSASSDAIHAIMASDYMRACGVYSVSAGSTDARTYSVRVGDSTGNNVTTNTIFQATATFGAVEACNLVVMEVLP